MEQYTLLKDGRHHWLKVPHAELERLGLHYSISMYSYVDESFAYLEDELDLFVFLRAKLKLPAVFAEFTAEHHKKYNDFFEDSLYDKFQFKSQLCPYHASCALKSLYPTSNLCLTK